MQLVRLSRNGKVSSRNETRSVSLVCILGKTHHFAQYAIHDSAHAQLLANRFVLMNHDR